MIGTSPQMPSCSEECHARDPTIVHHRHRTRRRGLRAAGQGAPERAAQVNGVPITAAEVDAKLGNNLAKLQEQIYSLRQKQLDSMIDQTLLEAEAARRGTTVAAVVQSEITSQVAPVTADETAKFYEENKARLPADFKTLEEQIRTYLNAQRLETNSRSS